MTDTAQAGALQAVPRHYIDNAELPQWAKASDGSNVKLIEDAQLAADFASWSAKACQHQSQFTGKTANSIGADVYKRYCRACGIATTQHLGHRTIANTTVTLVDNAAREKRVDAYATARREALDAITRAAADRAQPERRSDYVEYLASADWQKLRNAVIVRCGNLCEGCRGSGVDDVHHLTYRHIGREFLFELVGLCRACHTRWHEDAGEWTATTGAEK